MHEPRATRVHLETLGCRLNEAELEAWARSFRALGCRIVQDGETADLLVVNTCAVTAEAVRKSRKLLRRLKREHPAAPLVVSGCAASLRDLDLDPSPAQVSGTTTPARGIDLIVDNADKDRLVEIAAARLPLRTGLAPEAKAGAAEALFARGRQRAFVKVQDGCRYQCTFCVTTIARGAERSRAIGDIVTEINAVVGDRSAAGVREVILTGVQLGGYGREIAGTDESRLAELIEAVLRDTDVARLRLGSLEPWELPAGFWRLFEDRRLMPHLHMPMQSGSDTVLRRMARRCRAARFRDLVAEARSSVPDLQIGSDIIAGFPGETEAEWHETVEMVELLGLGQLHIFPYSPRPGTRAADLPDQVPEPIRRERARELHEIAARLRADTLSKHLGRKLPVLVEGENRDTDGAYAAGFTPNYLPVRLRPSRADAVGRIIDVELSALTSDREALEGRRPAAPLPQARPETA